MFRFIYATFVGLIGAVLVHLAIVLILPRLSSQDLWTQVEPISEINVPFRLDTTDTAAAKSIDPLFTVAACRFDLADGIFAMKASGRVEFWSVAVFDDRGNVLFSGNDRVAATDEIDIAIATRLQTRSIRQDRPAALDGAIITESAREKGLAVVRLYQPNDSWKAVAEEFVAGMGCTSVPV